MRKIAIGILFVVFCCALVSSDTYAIGSGWTVAIPWRDGTLDRSFNKDGKLTTTFTGSVRARAVAIQEDGKILVGGGSYLVRYNPDGTLDDSFSRDGRVTLSTGILLGMTIRGDGKIIVVGRHSDSWGSASVLFVFNPDGSLHDSDVEGLPGSFPDHYSFYSAAATQGDGKVLVAGSRSIRMSSGKFSLFRYHSDGSNDSTFLASDVDFSGLSEAVPKGIAIQDDGKILVGGVGSHRDSYGDRHAYTLARYNPDGALDASFGSGGKVISPDLTVGHVHSENFGMAIRGDGEIVVVGSYAASDFLGPVYLVYNSDGSIDSGETELSSDGKIITSDLSPVSTSYSFYSAVATQGDGKVLVAGSKSVSMSLGKFSLSRYNSDGPEDSSFVARDTEFTGGNAIPHAIAIQEDGKIILAGEVGSGSTARFAVARYLSNTGVRSLGSSTQALSTGEEEGHASATSASAEGASPEETAESPSEDLEDSESEASEPRAFRSGGSCQLMR